MNKLQPWQRWLWDYFDKLPPLPEGHMRKWYFDRKWRWRFMDIPPKEIYEDPVQPGHGGESSEFGEMFHSDGENLLVESESQDKQ